MKRQQTTGGLFLTELVLDLFLFSICAVICVSMLLKARQISNQSVELTQAVYLAQTAAETLRAGGSLSSPAKATEGYEVAVQELRGEAGLRKAQVTVFREGRELYSVTVAVQEEVGS